MSSKSRFVFKSLFVLFGVLVAAICVFLVYANHAINRELDTPYPPIKADMSPAAHARGRAIFRTMCESCHRAAESEQAAGAPLNELPSVFGSFHSANLTSHPTAGVGALRDEQIARMVRYGVNRHNRATIMPTSGMSDGDLAAVIGFMRSSDPLFKPVDRIAPRSVIAPVGMAIFVLSGATARPPHKVSGIVAPARAATPEYGRYMVENVWDCGGCHTKGFSPDKLQTADAFAGGFEFKDPAGQTVYSANLTPDASGLEKWSLDDFKHAVRDGVRPDGRGLRVMPRFRYSDDTEIEAIYRYLRTLPNRVSNVPADYVAAPAPVAVARDATNEAQLFQQLGCAACHATGAQYHDKLANARNKPADEVARWIRNPEQTKPDTLMPSFASRIDEDTALRLAEYVKRAQL